MEIPVKSKLAFGTMAFFTTNQEKQGERVSEWMNEVELDGNNEE